jgi:hypothetical protein
MIILRHMYHRSRLFTVRIARTALALAALAVRTVRTALALAALAVRTVRTSDAALTVRTQNLVRAPLPSQSLLRCVCGCSER